MIENDLSDTNVDDKLYHITMGVAGVCNIVRSLNGVGIVVVINGDKYMYDSNGKYEEYQLHPSLFKSLDHLIKYFTEVKNSEANKQGEISEKEN